MRRKLLAVFLVLSVVALLAVVLTPVWLIQPFRPQTPSGLALAFLFRDWSPIATLAGCLVVSVLALVLWKGEGWRFRAFLVTGCLLAFLAAGLARVNHFEMMFNPARSPMYQTASASTFVSDTDLVMSVVRDGASVAYPVRLLAYHHIVRDTVGGTPVVATY